MAESSTKASINTGNELSLGDDFGPAVVRFNGLTVSTDSNGKVRVETGRVTVDIADGNTSVYGGNVTAHTDGTVQLKAPAEEQMNTPGVIQSAPTSAAFFNPAMAMVDVGMVTLGTLSVYLREAHEHFPDLITEEQSRILSDHPAKLLAAPMDASLIRFTAQRPENMAEVTDLLKNGGIVREELLDIIRTNLGTANQDIATIRDINETHGIHHNGQVLKGMKIYDRPEDGPSAYEKGWARNVVIAFLRATDDGVTVTTDLAAGTKQAVHGREIGTGNVTVANNLYGTPGRGENAQCVNAALKAQGAQEIVTSDDLGGYAPPWQRTATEDPDDRSDVYTVDFTSGDDDRDGKGHDPSSCRPLALQIAPAPQLVRERGVSHLVI